MEIPIVDFRELTSNVVTGDSSAVIRERVAAARSIQIERFKSAKLTTNAAMGSRQVRDCCQLDAESRGAGVRGNAFPPRFLRREFFRETRPEPITPGEGSAPIQRMRRQEHVGGNHRHDGS
ncbi:MAG: hypothetical protein ACSHX7_09430 [Luteolibacter sp.]